MKIKRITIRFKYSILRNPNAVFNSGYLTSFYCGHHAALH